MFFDNRQTCVSWVLALLLLVISATHLKAQAVYGNIVGTVTDESGAVVPNAKVTVTDVNRGTVFSTDTNDSGNFTQAQLTPGTYRVAVEKGGFRRVVQESVTVSVGMTARVDARLAVGATTQEVTVHESPAGIEADRAEVTTALSSQQITQLPELNRNFTNLTLLVPGATINTFQHAPSENPQQSTLVNTNGQEFAGTNYLLDGMNNNDTVLGIVMVNPAIDSVAEAGIATSNYDAEFTQAGGAVVRVATKSGSNAIHGSAFDFLPNNIFPCPEPLSHRIHHTPTA